MKKPSIVLAFTLLLAAILLSFYYTSCSNEIVTHEVTFDSQGGSAVAAVAVLEGKKLEEPSNPSKYGYSFGGWYEDIAYVYKWNFGESAVIADMTLYAKWIANEYLITYHANGATFGSLPAGQTKLYDANLSISGNTGNLERTGYSFSGWNTQSDGSGIDYAPESSYTANETILLYAKWIANEYLITYHANGATFGSLPAGQTKLYDANLSISGNTGNLERTGYSFSGWNTQSDGSGIDYAPESSYTANEAILLFAKWNANTYTVTFNRQEGTGGSSSVEVDFNSPMPSATAPTKTGYAFNGYYDQAEGAGSQYYSPSMVSTKNWDKISNTTLYAKWSAIDYQITYELNEGANHSENPNEYCIEDLPLPFQAPTRTGYQFDGWYTDANFQAPILEISSSTTGNLVVYTKWNANSYQVSFEPYEGTPSPTSMTVTYGQPYGTLPMVSQTGYTLFGWIAVINSSAYYVQNDTVVTIPDDHTLYASFSAKTYTLTLDKQGGTGGSSSVTAEYNLTMPSATAPSHHHYTFEGYYDGENGTGTQYYDSVMESVNNWDKTEDTRLYASWEPYHIGDIGPAGGYIFYDDAIGYDADGNGTVDSDECDFLDDEHDYVLNGDRYLEAAPYGWYNGTTDSIGPYTGTNDPNFYWGSSEIYNANPPEAFTAVGTGESNTTNIVSDHESYHDTIAAKFCADYSSVTGELMYDDWFLPSKDELNLMYLNLKVQKLGSFSDASYWSSSGHRLLGARYQRFTDGYQYEDYRYSRYSVRPVRAF